MPAPFLDWLAIINLLGVVQGLFLAVIFLSMRRGNRPANRLLGLLLLSMALLITDLFLSYTNYILYVPALINTTEAVAFWIGPMLYFYTRTLVGPPLHWRRDWLHLLPGLVQVVSRIPFYLQSNAYKIRDTMGAFHRDLPEALRVPPEPILWYPDFKLLEGVGLDVLSFSSLFFYHVLVFRLIGRHTRRRGEPFWNASDVALRALPRLMALFLVFLVAAVGFTFTSEDDLGDIYIATASSVIFYGITFYFLTHPELLHAGKPEAVRKKYEKSSLAPEVAGSMKERLLGCMESEKPYLDSELTLAQLAEKLRTSTHHLSQLVNEGLGVNFADFVNQYRIEAVKGKLRDPAYGHLKIEEIAYQTGFNSKSTFQAAFKKFAGVTPSEYRKKGDGKIITNYE
ncbi:MAG: helix-turn-helix transcriptional regulator [Cytophagales bacterium]|nr:helix-turn-helix transcriptional regulator [Cytophagales bacterium]